MGLEDLEPIFGEPRIEPSGSNYSVESRPFLFHVHAPDPSHVAIHVTDFHSNTWEALRSVHQLEDMRDDVRVGETLSEFMDYVLASLKSQDVKLILDGHPNLDSGSAASSPIANLSLQLFNAFKSTSESYVEEKAQSIQ